MKRFMQLIPRTRWSIYHNVQTGKREFCIWKQWLGKAYDVRSFALA